MTTSQNFYILKYPIYFRINRCFIAVKFMFLSGMILMYDISEGLVCGGYDRFLFIYQSYFSILLVVLFIL